MIVQPFTVDTANHGRLWFLHENLEIMAPYRVEVRSRLLDELELSQPEGRCETLGMDPKGEDEHLRIGVFTSEKPGYYPIMFGAYYLGRVFWKSGEARMMGAFPHVPTEQLGQLHADIMEALLSRPLVDERGAEYQIMALRFAVHEEQRARNGDADERDKRALASLAGVKSSRALSVASVPLKDKHNEYAATLV